MNVKLYSYVVIFDQPHLREFTDVIDTYDQEIVNWQAVLPHTVFVTTSFSAKRLVDFLGRLFPTTNRLLVMDAETDRNGWLPPYGHKGFCGLCMANAAPKCKHGGSPRTTGSGRSWSSSRRCK